jgi:hypothetical protein
LRLRCFLVFLGFLLGFPPTRFVFGLRLVGSIKGSSGGFGVSLVGLCDENEEDSGYSGYSFDFCIELLIGGKNLLSVIYTKLIHFNCAK